MISRRLLAALGTTACLTAAVLSAAAAALRSFDRELASYTVEIRDVPGEWVVEFYGECAGDDL